MSIEEVMREHIVKDFILKHKKHAGEFKMIDLGGNWKSVVCDTCYKANAYDMKNNVVFELGEMNLPKSATIPNTLM